MIDVYVARQPIFDAEMRIAGYELLYRSGAESGRADGTSAEQMTGDVLVHAFLGIGIDRMTEGTPCFVNLPQSMIVDEHYTLLDPRKVVIEVLESVECTPETEAALARMAAHGYRIALDDFELLPERLPLLRFADVVKIDVLDKSSEELRRMVETLRPYGVRLLAERIETAARHAECRALGFVLFQGFHLAQSETLSRGDMPVDFVQTVELMNLLQEVETSDAQLDDALQQNVSVAYRLLRIVNSAATGGRGIRSIQHAVRLVGRQALHRWVALVLVSSVTVDDDAGLEQLHASLRCARICERLAAAVGRPQDAGPLFMVGMLSRLDLLLRRPLDEIVERINLDADVRAAVLREGGPYLATLDLVEAYEAGQWEAVDAGAAELGIAPGELPSLYLDALSWGRERVHLARA